jgi:hypothetical protein
MRRQRSFGAGKSSKPSAKAAMSNRDFVATACVSDDGRSRRSTAASGDAARRRVREDLCAEFDHGARDGAAPLWGPHDMAA